MRKIYESIITLDDFNAELEGKKLVYWMRNHLELYLDDDQAYDIIQIAKDHFMNFYSSNSQKRAYDMTIDIVNAIRFSDFFDVMVDHIMYVYENLDDYDEYNYDEIDNMFVYENNSVKKFESWRSEIEDTYTIDNLEWDDFKSWLEEKNLESYEIDEIENKFNEIWSNDNIVPDEKYLQIGKFIDDNFNLNIEKEVFNFFDTKK